jgi:hypothetical protein
MLPVASLLFGYSWFPLVRFLATLLRGMVKILTKSYRPVPV